MKAIITSCSLLFIPVPMISTDRTGYPLQASTTTVKDINYWKRWSDGNDHYHLCSSKVRNSYATAHSRPCCFVDPDNIRGRYYAVEKVTTGDTWFAKNAGGHMTKWWPSGSLNTMQKIAVWLSCPLQQCEPVSIWRSEKCTTKSVNGMRLHGSKSAFVRDPAQRSQRLCHKSRHNHIWVRAV